MGSGVAGARDLVARLHEVRQRIAAAAAAAGRDPADVTLVAVTKTVAADTIARAYALGLRVFGENRVQEARDKLRSLSLPGARWELIGHVQTNKAGAAAELFDRVQSVDSLRLAQALDMRAERLGRILPVLLEVNVAGEASKSGIAPAELVEVARAVAALPHLRPEGLMTVAPLAADPETVRPVFSELRRLRDRVRLAAPVGREGGWPQLSMGMSDDYGVAIAEGATIIRLGRALFGARPTARPDP
jgi:pyridoxal phosphate enzyme (YggS family)